jgi:GT2 family glycosyltransferase
MTLSISSEDITVGVSSYGRPAALERCLAGLAAGTARPREVIVVDQRPADESRAVVRSFSPALDIRYVEQAQLGLSASRNLMLALTTTAFLAMTDDDCVPSPEWLAAMTAALALDAGLSGVTGPILALGERPPGARAASLRPSVTTATYSGRPLPWLVGSGGNFAISTDLVRRVGGWDERLGAGSAGRSAEDVEIIDRLMRAGAVVRYDAQAVVRHDWHPAAHRSRARWSYRYGVGAFVAMRLARRDRFGWRILAAYVRLSLGIPEDLRDTWERTWTLAGLVPGFVYGVRCLRGPRTPAGAGRRSVAFLG